jgi:hypothetical protein
MIDYVLLEDYKNALIYIEEPLMLLKHNLSLYENVRKDNKILELMTNQFISIFINFKYRLSQVIEHLSINIQVKNIFIMFTLVLFELITTLDLKYNSLYDNYVILLQIVNNIIVIIYLET